jgi:2-hydroxy-3-keto-5-methylthiopentenyl-1-phosphate phosphatase
MSTAVQLDFDGTVTVHDISYLLLDAYAGAAWWPHLEDYEAGRTTVGTFNRRVFGLVTAGRDEMTEFVLRSERLVIRDGFREFIEYCRGREFPIIITSNGLRFYIEAILARLGIEGIEVRASENEFSEHGMKVAYLGPDGAEVEVGFKEAHTRALMAAGYDVLYAGDGSSDIGSARLATHVFAADKLLEKCRRENLTCYPFRDFQDILAKVKTLKLP